MIEKIISTLIGSIVTGLVGFFVGIIKTYKKNIDNYRERDLIQEEALKCLLRSNITSKYYVYKELGVIPHYEKENIDYMFQQYKEMGGNSYVEQIVSEINRLPVDNK